MNLLFDLDGTLTDPVVGITSCIQHALRRLGVEPPPAAALARFVGPPLRGTFAELLATDDAELVARAIACYRERFADVGMFENEVYPHVIPGLQALAADGHQLWVATSKPHVYARRIVEHFGMRPLFRGVYGSELDGRNTDKGDLLRALLDEQRLAARDTWMVGDRGADVRGGRSNGTRTAGALWGYGSEDELRAAGPDVLLGAVGDLRAHVHTA